MGPQPTGLRATCMRANLVGGRPDSQTSIFSQLQALRLIHRALRLKLFGSCTTASSPWALEAGMCLQAWQQARRHCSACVHTRVCTLARQRVHSPLTRSYRGRTDAL